MPASDPQRGRSATGIERYWEARRSAFVRSAEAWAMGDPEIPGRPTAQPG